MMPVYDEGGAYTLHVHIYHMIRIYLHVKVRPFDLETKLELHFN